MIHFTGPLADRWGPRRVLETSLEDFLLGSGGRCAVALGLTSVLDIIRLTGLEYGTTEEVRVWLVWTALGA